MAEAIVCGAGAAGLAAAAALRAVDVDVAVLERTDEVAASWRTRYDGLRLNTPGWMSTQPGYRASRRRYGEFPSRDAWISYLEDYAAHHRIDVRFGTRARRLEPVDGGWRIETDRDRPAGELRGHRDRFRPRPRHPRLAGTRRLRRRADPFQRLPKPRPLPRPRRARRRAGHDRLGGRRPALAGRRRTRARRLQDAPEPDDPQGPRDFDQRPLGWRWNACRCASPINSAGFRNGVLFGEPRSLRAAALADRNRHHHEPPPAGPGLRQRIRGPPQGRDGSRSSRRLPGSTAPTCCSPTRRGSSPTP